MNIDAASAQLWHFLIDMPEASVDAQVQFLADRGYSKVECIGAFNRVYKLGLGEAKKIVHLSPVFEYRRANDDAFHDELISIIERGESMTLRSRAVAIILNDATNDQAEVLLMLRRKAGRAYATLPGGGIEDGETPAQACIREVLEEVNLTVTVGPEILVLENIGNLEHYFQAQVQSGEMRLGDGPEAIRSSDENWYSPQWVPLTDLDAVNLVPEQARELVREVAAQ